MAKDEDDDLLTCWVDVLPPPLPYVEPPYVEPPPLPELPDLQMGYVWMGLLDDRGVEVRVEGYERQRVIIPEGNVMLFGAEFPRLPTAFTVAGVALWYRKRRGSPFISRNTNYAVVDPSMSVSMSLTINDEPLSASPPAGAVYRQIMRQNGVL